MLKILVTGGAGYIGSHTAVELLKIGHDVVIYDNFINSSKKCVDSIREVISTCVSAGVLYLVEGDVSDEISLNEVFCNHQFDLVLHFAGLKSVSESNMEPISYYSTNFVGTLTLCNAMAKAGVFAIIFSSSATVYGDCQLVPITENCSGTEPVNPYGRSKMMAEILLTDLARSDSRWAVGLLRYFNPVGAHESGLIGESPVGVPNNLFPYIADVASGKLSHLSIFGADYPTKDGTGIRDYIHVSDLALGHLAAMKWVLGNKGVETWNLGTGKGYSVLEVIEVFKRVSGKDVSCKLEARRQGDVAESYADPSKAFEELQWQATFNLDRMVADTWRWKTVMPSGY